MVIQTQGFKSFIVELTKAVVSVRKDGGTVVNKVGKISNEVNEVKKCFTKVEQKNDTQVKHVKLR